MTNNTLGCEAGEILIHKLKPKHWFSAHMHCPFSATVQHNEHQPTHFLALDKCLPNRQFLQVRKLYLKQEIIFLQFSRITNIFLIILFPDS